MSAAFRLGFRTATLFLCLCFTGSALVTNNALASTVHLVRQDGTGDFSSIQAAMDAAESGDEILVGDGSYVEGLDFTKSLVIRSENGALHTIVDGGDSVICARVVEPDIQIELVGLTLRRGYTADAGAGLNVRNGARATASDCIFVENVSNFQAGGFHVRDPGGYLRVENCVVRNNHATVYSGGGTVILGATLEVVGTWFEANTSEAGAALAMNDDASMIVEWSTFVRNVATSSPSALWWPSAAGFGLIENCTFYENESSGYTIASVGSPVTVARCIIANERGGGAFGMSSPFTLECNLVWNNDGGVGNAPLASFIEADPIFCDPSIGDFQVAENSPAAGGIYGCGLIGVSGIGCGPQTQELTLAILDAYVPEAGEVSVPVELQYPAGWSALNAVASVEFEVTWDPTIDVEFEGASKLPATEGWILAASLLEPGRARVGLVSAQGLDPGGAAVGLLTLDLVVPSQEQNLGLDLEATRLYDAALAEVPHQTQGGVLVFQCDKGDPTGDGRVDTADAVFTLQAVLGIRHVTAIQECAADVDGDGIITVADAIAILRMFINPEPSSPTLVAAAPEVWWDNASSNVLHASSVAGLDVTIDLGDATEGVSVRATNGLIASRMIAPGVLRIVYANIVTADVEITLEGVDNASPVILSWTAYDEDGQIYTIPTSVPPVRPSVLTVAPNPFNPRTKIEFRGQPSAATRLQIFDLRGRLVVSLFDGIASGELQEIIWNAGDAASGVYMLRMTSGDQTKESKLTLLK